MPSGCDLKNRLLLVVDDDPGIRLIAKRMMEDGGFRVCEAGNGAQAVQGFAMVRPDMVMMDIDMPLMNGYEACAAIRKLPCSDGVPIVMVTGMDDMQSITRAYNAGATDFITKPINWTILKHRIRYILRASWAFNELKESESRFIEMAHHDTLTGLPNRLIFNDRLDHALKDSRRNEHDFAVMFLDLDRFKIINDTLGHDTGDALLKSVSHRLQTCLRESDTIARQGGDEFIVILSGIGGVRNAARVAGAILRTLSEPFMLNSHSAAIGVSIGIAMFPNDGQDADTLTKNADIAMYRAKELGRNNYQFYKPSLNAAVSQRLMLESSLINALENEEFILQYQPIVEIATGSITGAEALIRWRKPSGEIVSPAALIPIAEETGLIVKIGEWTVRTVCRQMREWIGAGTNPPSVAINLSAMQLHRPGLAGCVHSSLRENRVPPSMIELEITETTAMLDDSAASKVLHEISSHGIRIAIDDFGTGYSSLSRLSEFPVNRLKIDRSFICGIPGDGKAMAIARSVIDLGRNLGIRVTAEGVETGEQLAFLRDHGCDDAQGYLFSRPLDPDAFAGLPGNFAIPDAGCLLSAAA